MSKIDEVIQAAEQSTFIDLVQQGTEQLKPLLDQAIELFEQFSFGDQALAMGLMFGMLHAVLEGHLTTLERDYGEIVSFEDKLRLFNAVATSSYRSAMAEGKDPACPGNSRLM